MRNADRLVFTDDEVEVELKECWVKLLFFVPQRIKANPAFRIRQYESIFNTTQS
jgi:hypothetical protein